MAEGRPRRLRSAPTPSTTQRVVDVLAVFLDGREDAGVSELAREMRTSKSVVHRILQGLTEAGFMTADPVSRRYRLGPLMIRLGLVAVRHLDLKTTALPYLRAIHDETHETALLALLRGDRRIYLAQIEGQHMVRSAVGLGQEAPLYVGASGKAMLAFLPPALMDAVLASARGQRLATGAPIRISALEAELEDVRRTRIAVAANELAMGAAAVASPVFDEQGQVIGSLGVASVSVRTDRRTLLRYGTSAKAQADRLSRALGWGGRVGSP
jgi:IclR family acetate operon transcriptional repressor